MWLISQQFFIDSQIFIIACILTDSVPPNFHGFNYCEVAPIIKEKNKRHSLAILRGGFAGSA